MSGSYPHDNPLDCTAFKSRDKGTSSQLNVLNGHTDTDRTGVISSLTGETSTSTTLGDATDAAVLPSLWLCALDKIRSELPGGNFETDWDDVKPQDAIKVAEERWEDSKKKKLQYVTPSGQIIYLTDVFENIIRHFKMWTKPIDTIVSYDPLHLALPWALIQVSIQLADAPAQTYGQILSGIEYIGGLVSGYDANGQTFAQATPDMDKLLRHSLIQLYVAVLRWLIALYKYIEYGRTKRFIRSNFPKSSRDFALLMDGVQASERAVLNVMTRISFEDAQARTRRLTRKLTIKEESEQDFLKSTPTQAQLRQNRILKLSSWLQSSDKTEIFQKAAEKCYPGTSAWILSRDVYKTWLASNQGQIMMPCLLWINSAPGFGKTVLCTQILQEMGYNITDEPKSLAAYFCSSEKEDWRSTSAILHSWIAQLAEADDRSFKLVFDMYSTSSGQSPTESELWNLLKEIARAVSCTLVVDGLDECSRIVSKHDKYDDNRSAFLHRLITNLQHTKTRVLLSSRGHNYIRSVLYERMEKEELQLYEQVITKDDTEQDVSAYLASIMKETLPNTKSDVRDDLTQRSAEKSEGMFMYVNMLKPLMKKGHTPVKIKETISSMPKDLETIYENELKSILTASSRKDVVAVFRWLLFATRPLTLRELAEALMLTRNDTSSRYPQDDLPDGFDHGILSPDWIGSAVITNCGAFIELRSPNDSEDFGSKTVHFPHSSMREFLIKSLREQSSELGFKDSEIEKDYLDSLCLKYLCYDVFGVGRNLRAENFRHNYPFFFYAAVSWYERSQNRNVTTTDLKQALESLLNPRIRNWISWSDAFEAAMKDDSVGDSSAGLPQGAELGESDVEAMDEINEPSDTDDDPSDTDSCLSEDTSRKSLNETNLDGPIYYASLLGLPEFLRSLRSRARNIAKLIGKYGTPLQAAAKAEHIDIVDYLIGDGADVNEIGGHYGTALAAAASTGNLAIVEKLLIHNANPKLGDDHNRNAFHIACHAGHDKIAEHLLQHDKTLVNSETIFKNTPMVMAIPSGNLKLIKILKDSGADMNALRYEENGKQTTLIGWAIALGQPRAVKYLLKHGSLVEAVNSGLANNLMVAAQYADEKSFFELMKNGANINYTNAEGWTVLHSAAYGGNPTIIKEVLDSGLSVHAVASNGVESLYAAAIGNQPESIRTLHALGANLDKLIADGSTALLGALKGGHNAAAKTLIELGADIHTTGMFGNSAIDEAMENGNEEMIQYIISRGGMENLEIKGPAMVSVLEIYRSISKQDEITFLEEFDKRTRTGEFNQTHKDSVLLISVFLGAKMMIEGMLERGANPNGRTSLGRTPLMIATRRRNELVVDVLLNRGALTQSLDNNGFGPIHIALSQGLAAKSVLERILKAGGLFVNGLDYSPVSLDHAEKFNGTWSGFITSSDWEIDGGTDVKLDMDFTLEPDVYHCNLPWFQYNGEDGTGQVLTIGFALGNDKFVFLRMNDGFGWMCEGQLEERSEDGAGLTIKGYWGERHGHWHGMFEINKA